MATGRSQQFEPTRLPSYSEQDVVEEIRRAVGLFGGEIPSCAQFRSVARVSLNSIFRRFGSYPKALAKAGFVYKKPRSVSRRRHSREQVLDNLREVLARADGYEFTIDFYRDNGGLFRSRDSVKQHLGLSWQAALAAVGAKKRLDAARGHLHKVHVSIHAQRLAFLAALSEEQLLDELELAWQRRGGCPTRADLKRGPKGLNAALYGRRFGSWEKAIEALCKRKNRPMPRIPGTPLRKVVEGNGPEPHECSHLVAMTSDDLLAELREVREKDPSSPLSYTLYRLNGGKYHIDTFRTRFETWADAVRAVGGTLAHAYYSRDDLFDEMQRLWEKLGRQPTFDEMNLEGKISAATYHKRFGSWTKAVHAFCEDRNSDRPDPEILTAPAVPTTKEITGANNDFTPLVSAIEPVGPSAASTKQAVTNSDSPEPETLTVRVVLPTDHIGGLRSDFTPPVSATEPVAPGAPTAKIILRKTGRAVGKRLRWLVFVRDKFTCKACGRSPAKHGIVLHADHVVAYSNGGETVLENLEAKCEDCNIGKSNR